MSLEDTSAATAGALASVITAAASSGVDNTFLIKQHRCLMKIQASIAPYYLRNMQGQNSAHGVLPIAQYRAVFESISNNLVSAFSTSFYPGSSGV